MTGAFNGGAQNLTNLGSNITGAGAVTLGAGGICSTSTLTPTERRLFYHQAATKIIKPAAATTPVCR